MGEACEPIQWGTDIDIEVENTLAVPQAVNVLFDWNQDGEWGGQSICSGSIMAKEHAVFNPLWDGTGDFDTGETEDDLLRIGDTPAAVRPMLRSTATPSSWSPTSPT
ncbi:hypothetical protein COW53_09375 [bacterium CG17_big_fil_post_rev_8_21_14_2_50_64_8]|nr:MAG: hypothetical protein COW53_09375 [bacterium CG17_big_fil_post_rev_8_21_14_2_50_64_8]